MVTTRLDTIPGEVRDAISEQVGPILHLDTVTGGWNSEIAARVRTSNGTVFVKGLRTDHRRVWTQRREAEIGPYVQSVAPRVLWHLENADWSLVAFEHLDGRHADYTPTSADIPLIVDALERLAAIPCPDLPLRVAEQRWSAYIDDPSMLDALRGDALLHTDFNNQNVLITHGQARFVDWAWATRGAPWIDPALWVIWLIAAGGHTPASAESWAARTTVWHTAPTPALNTFADANAKLWRDIAGDNPDAWTTRMTDAANQWAAYRLPPTQSHERGGKDATHDLA
jgi:hypothetical protein